MNYSDLVRRLGKPGAKVMADLTPERVELWGAATGVAGEAGELLDAVKKHVMHNKPLELTAMVKEMGDIEFYLEWMRQCLGVTREQVLEVNVEKLSARYATGSYSDDQSQARVDNRRTLVQVLDELEIKPELIIVSDQTWKELRISGHLIFNSMRDCWTVREIEVHRDVDLQVDYELPKTFG